MAIPVIMPRQGQSVESCIFDNWYFEKGDQVKKGDVLFSYETDKAVFDGEAPENGILLAKFAEPGDEVPVLQNIAVIGKEGEDIDNFRPEHSGVSKKDEKNEIMKSSSPESKAPGEKEPVEEGILKISPRAKKTAERMKVSFTGISGSGPYGRIIEKDILEKSKKSPKATPLAISISSKDHIDLPASGSGTGGRILASDLKKRDETVLSDSYEEKQISNIRRIIAENMHASLQNTAQLTLHTSADARKIKTARTSIKKEIEKSGGINITINDMVCYAAVQALLKYKNMNAHFMRDHIRFYNNVHLGFAVDTERGLMVPTLRNANYLKLEGLSAQMKELAILAQDGKINPELLKDATFTVTNLGAYGIEIFTPVLNPPQVGILGVNTITLQPAALEGGSFGFIPKIGLSLTFDHRAVDGAPAAAFLQEVKQQIEIFKIE